VLRFAARRLAIAVPLLLVTSLAVFALVSLSGDPLADLKLRQPPVPQHTIDLQRHRLGLDEPFFTRYWHWLTGVLHGDFGPSTQGYQSVGHAVWSAFGVTVRLVLVAVVLAVVLAVVVGVVSAARRYGPTDHSLTFVSFLFLAMPTFWLAILLKYGAIWLNDTTGHRLLFTAGERTPSLQGDWWARLGDTVGHLVLPTIVLALASYAAWSRFARASMIEALSADHVRFARAKGLRRRRVLVRHGLRTALAPLVTVVAIDFSALLSGAIVTEMVFEWRGMGQLLLRAVQARDSYMVLGWLLVTATVVIVVNLIADLLYAVLDPRVRHG
jgi:peptide/nickel transport system permease protein